MVEIMEITVESDRYADLTSGVQIHVGLLGRMSISRAGRPLTLPASRKLRALIAYLALAPHALTRERLCELLWDIPNDPRGELRWCLSKARCLLDEPARSRVRTDKDTVRLDLTDCYVDVTDINRWMQQGLPTLGTERLRALSGIFGGDFLEGLQIERSPDFQSWLNAQRRRLRACHAAILEHLVARLATGSQESFSCLDKWLQLVPFDLRVHELVLQALTHRGRLREGEEHLAATVRAFELEGLDSVPLRKAWRDAKTRAAGHSGPEHTLLCAAGATLPASESDASSSGARRASIVIMPFLDRSAPSGARGGIADALAFDIITRLAKLRSLFVIAQGTAFALDQRNIGPEEAARTLNVDYLVSGSLRRQAKRLIVNVELVESRTARIVWADFFDYSLDDTFLALNEMGDRIVASIDTEVEMAERNRAILKPPSSLDAWGAHHRGLWHMYRFNRGDNELAMQFFKTALRLDPTFSRAYAGLSFTHWQNAFQGWGEEHQREIDLAFETAGQSVFVDDRDPAAHWAMGRALWLRGERDQSLTELQRTIDLSPNFALGHYTLGFVNCQSGDAKAAIDSSDHSRRLSPFDPLLFGMLAVRAIALVRLGRFDEAADWSLMAVARPHAHAHILAIAAQCLALAGRVEEARNLVSTLHKLQPSYSIDGFVAAFRLSADTEALFRKAAERIGIA